MFGAYGLGLGMTMGLSIASASSLITHDIVSKTVNITMYSLSSTLSYMAESSENMSIKKYHSELESLDIEFKLNLIHNWLKKNKDICGDNCGDIERNNKTEDSHDIKNEDENQFTERNETRILIYNGIKDVCLKIDKSIEKINTKIKEHQEKWFHTYRNLYIDDEIDEIKKYNKIFNERIYMVMLK